MEGKAKRAYALKKTNEMHKRQARVSDILDEFTPIRGTRAARMDVYNPGPLKPANESTWQKMDDILDYWEDHTVIKEIGQAFWDIIPELGESVSWDYGLLKEKLMEWREQTAKKYSYSVDLTKAIINRYLRLYAEQDGEDLHFGMECYIDEETGKPVFKESKYQFDRQRYDTDPEYRRVFEDLIRIDINDQKREMYGENWADLARIMLERKNRRIYME